TKAAAAHLVRNALRNFTGRRFTFGNRRFLLDRAGMRHILERHHPAFWNGTVKAEQTFFSASMRVDAIANAISSVMQQNRTTLIRKGTTGRYQVMGVVDGVKYVLGINNG